MVEVDRRAARASALEDGFNSGPKGFDKCQKWIEIEWTLPHKIYIDTIIETLHRFLVFIIDYDLMI